MHLPICAPSMELSHLTTCNLAPVKWHVLPRQGAPRLSMARRRHVGIAGPRLAMPSRDAKLAIRVMASGSSRRHSRRQRSQQIDIYVLSGFDCSVREAARITASPRSAVTQNRVPHCTGRAFSFKRHV